MYYFLEKEGGKKYSSCLEREAEVKELIEMLSSVFGICSVINMFIKKQ